MYNLMSSFIPFYNLTCLTICIVPVFSNPRLPVALSVYSLFTTKLWRNLKLPSILFQVWKCVWWTWGGILFICPFVWAESSGIFIKDLKKARLIPLHWIICSCMKYIQKGTVFPHEFKSSCTQSLERDVFPPTILLEITWYNFTRAIIMKYIINLNFLFGLSHELTWWWVVSWNLLTVFSYQSTNYPHISLHTYKKTYQKLHGKFSTSHQMANRSANTATASAKASANTPANAPIDTPA